MSSNKEAVLAAWKPHEWHDAVSVLFGRTSPTTFLTSIRLAMLRKPRFSPYMVAQNTFLHKIRIQSHSKSRVWSQWKSS